MALTIAVGKIVISILSAYAITFFRFPFRMAAFWTIFITLMLPVEVRIIPTYSVMSDLGLINTFPGMTIPLIASATATLLFRQTFLVVPDELVEAARMDGATRWKEIVYVLAPMAVPGIASTVLLNVILSWNEAFWTLNLTTTNAAPLTAFIASYSSPEGLFWAKLSAASTLAVAPILILGWFSQKQLVRGLTFGAVK